MFRDLPADQQIGGYPKPGQLSNAIDEATLDSEGRCVILEFPAFVLIGVYSPAQRDETRTEFRQSYVDAIDVRVRNLVAMGKQVFLCGDLNISRSEMDSAGVAECLRKEGITLDDYISTPSRRFLNQLVFGGRVVGKRDEGREEPVLWDLCREFHPTRAGMYTCWETKKNARPGNYGSRIDYVLCSSGIKDWFIDANIQEGLLGSDHCPVYATIGDTVNSNGTKVHIEDVMNPPGIFREGKRQRGWSPKDLLPTSAKLIPEFDRRRSIRDMFFKKAVPSAKTDSSTPQSSSQDASKSANTTAGSANSSGSAKDDPVPVSSPLRRISNSTPLISSQEPPSRKREADPSRSPGRPQKKGKVSLNRENSSKSGAGFSQSSLKGFFKPKMPAPGADPATDADSGNDTTPGPTADTQPSAAPAQKQGTQSGGAGSNKAAIGEDGAGSEEDSKPSNSAVEKVFDPIEAKESWSKLLGKRVVPKCEHGEDCQMLVTKKAGINCGMYSCLPVFPRPPAMNPRRLLCVSFERASSCPWLFHPSMLLVTHHCHCHCIPPRLTRPPGRSFFMCARPLGPSGDKEQGTEFRCRTFIWSSDWNGRQ